MSALAPFLALLFASLLPRVEDPLPDRIGLGFPLAAAGAGGALAGLVSIGFPPAKRERAIGWGGFAGFCFGLAFYFLAFCVQVASRI